MIEVPGGHPAQQYGHDRGYIVTCYTATLVGAKSTSTHGAGVVGAASTSTDGAGGLPGVQRAWCVAQQLTGQVKEARLSFRCAKDTTVPCHTHDAGYTVTVVGAGFLVLIALVHVAYRVSRDAWCVAQQLDCAQL
jgi:hypothetical protein